MLNRSKIRIFLAHAKEDKEKVRELYKRLQQSGYSPWFDEESLLPGQIWQKEIRKAIENSDLFIACLSKQSIIKKGYVQKEFKLALNYCAEMPSEEIYLIPLKLEDCHIPDLRQEEYGVALRDYQWLNYYEDNGYDKLIQTIKFKQSKTSIPQVDIKQEDHAFILNEVEISALRAIKKFQDDNPLQPPEPPVEYLVSNLVADLNIDYFEANEILKKFRRIGLFESIWDSVMTFYNPHRPINETRPGRLSKSGENFIKTQTILK